MKRSDFLYEHPCGLRIGRALREDEVAALCGGETRDMGNGFVWRPLPVAEVEGGVLVMSLCFYRGTLVTANVRVGDPAAVGQGWENWSEAEERACVKRTEKWLRTLGYRPGNYRWCEIFTGYDAKGGSGGGVIRFHA